MSAYRQPDQSLTPAMLRVAVVGPPQSGKSSIIKRIVSHRFDNLPTFNKEFMGMPSDGRHAAAAVHSVRPR